MTSVESKWTGNQSRNHNPNHFFCNVLFLPCRCETVRVRSQPDFTCIHAGDILKSIINSEESLRIKFKKKRKENHWEFWLSVDWWVPCRLKITGSPKKKKKTAKWFSYWTKSVKVLLGDDSPEFRSLWADLSITFPYRTIFFFTITLGPLVSQHRSVWIEFIIVEIENWKLKVL